MTSTRKKVFKSTLSVGNFSCSLVEWGVCHSYKHFALRVTVNFNCYIETLRSLNAHLCWVGRTWNCQKYCFLGPHPSVHTTETIIRYGWAVLLRPSCTPDPNTISFTCLVLQRMAWNDSIMQIMRHCRTLRARGCRGGSETFTGLDYSPMF